MSAGGRQHLRYDELLDTPAISPQGNNLLGEVLELLFIDRIIGLRIRSAEMHPSHYQLDPSGHPSVLTGLIFVFALLILSEDGLGSHRCLFASFDLILRILNNQGYPEYAKDPACPYFLMREPQARVKDIEPLCPNEGICAIRARSVGAQ